MANGVRDLLLRNHRPLGTHDGTWSDGRRRRSRRPSPTHRHPVRQTLPADTALFDDIAAETTGGAIPNLAALASPRRLRRDYDDVMIRGFLVALLLLSACSSNPSASGSPSPDGGSAACP